MENKTVSVEDIDAVLRFLPLCERPNYDPVESAHMMWISYDEETMAFMSFLERSDFPFKFEWTTWEEGKRLDADSSLFASADLLTIRKFFFTLMRAERFCCGAFGGAITGGTFAAALRRLQELRNEM